MHEEQQGGDRVGCRVDAGKLPGCQMRDIESLEFHRREPDIYLVAAGSHSRWFHKVIYINYPKPLDLLQLLLFSVG